MECHGQLGLPTPAHSFRSPLDLKKKKKGYPCFTFSALRKLSPDLCKKRLKCLKVVWGEHRFALTSLWQDVSTKKFGRVTRIVLQGNQTKRKSLLQGLFSLPFAILTSCLCLNRISSLRMECERVDLRASYTRTTGLRVLWGSIVLDFCLFGLWFCNYFKTNRRQWIGIPQR